MELIEREALIADLMQRWVTAKSGRGCLVFLGGEAGAGKTQALRAFQQQLPAGTRLLTGYCDALSTPRPLGPLFDMYAGSNGGVGRLLQDDVQTSTLFPAVLRDLGDGPVFVIVEDAHWADDATIDLLRFLGRRIESAPALVAVSYRDDEIGREHPLTRLLGDLATVSAVHRLQVDPFSPAGVESLVGERQIDATALFHRTGGNPFFVTEILASGDDAIPATVREAVLARAGKLSPQGWEALESTAIAGPVAENWLLATLPGTPDGIDECVEAGILRPVQGVSYEFRHELARQAILGSIPFERRRGIDERVLLALEAQPANDQYLARLAHHAEQLGDGHRVARYAPRAAVMAREVNAHRESIAQIQRALRFSEAADLAKRAELLSFLAESCAMTSQLDTEIEARAAAIDIWKQLGDDGQRAEQLARMGAAMVMQGRNAEGEAAMTAALGLLEELPEAHVHATVYWLESTLRMLNRDAEEAVHWGTRAIAIAERFGDLRVITRCENAIGAALMVSDRFEEGRGWLERSRDHGVALNHSATVAVAYSNLGSGAGEIHRFGYAREQLKQAIAIGTEFDLDGNRLYAESWLALCELHLGNWPESAELAGAVVRHPYSPVVGRIMALIALGRLRARRGDPEVWSVLDEARTLAEATGTLQRVGPVAAARAEAFWLSGKAGAVAEEVRDAYELAVRHGHVWFTGELGYWLWKTGALRAVPEFGALPYLLQSQGQWGEAATLWRAMGCEYNAASALVESGEGEAMLEGLRSFEALGARPATALTIRALRERGTRGIPRGSRATTREHPAHLTEREAEVLAALVEGKSNPEIAAALFLSPRTIERHLSSIFSKLGVSTRREAVERAKELGL